MKKQRKFIATIVTINIFATMLHMPIFANVQENYTTVETSVKQAINEKSFYYYNMAYTKIMDLPEGYERDKLLSELDSISSIIWTKEISEIIEAIENMAKEKSGRLYDVLEAKIGKSDIQDIDKGYLLGEITGWGRELIWTDDYKKAIGAVIEVWNKKTELAAEEAGKAIDKVKIKINKDYLLELLNEAKNFLKLGSLTVDSKYFNDSSSAYIGDGRSVNLDLTTDTGKRYVTLKGKYANLNINAPMATVILEDAVIDNLNVLDVASSSIYLKGSTKVQNLVVNDKDDNANIVIQGSASVENTEVKSGARVEVGSDSKASNPFGNLKINSDQKKSIELKGYFKGTVISIEKPAEFKVFAVINNIHVGRGAEDSVISISSGARVNEIVADAALKVQGSGILEKVSGSASSKVIDNTNNNSGNESSSEPSDINKPVITLIGNTSVTVVNGHNYVDQGATALDYEDGNITAKISKTIKDPAGNVIDTIDTRVAGTYTITYNVSDAVGNKANDVVRTVIVLEAVEVDNIKPVIILLGQSIVTLENGAKYVDAGATASDNSDGDITAAIVKIIKDKTGKVIDAIDTKIAGNYTITYSVSDKAGNTADEVVRTVTVGELKAIKDVVINANSSTGKVTVEGNIVFGNGKNITFIVLDPIGEINNINQVVSGETGKFNYNFTIADLVDGTYTLRIGGEGVDKPYSESFEIKDVIKPVITLLGDPITSVTSGAIYIDAGAKAYDDRDGDITNKLVATIRNTTGSVIQVITNTTASSIQITDTRQSEVYTITYSVTDKTGNVAEEIVRIITILPAIRLDDIKPLITLSGVTITTVTGGAIYVFEGISARDNNDGDISNKVVATIANISGSIMQEISNTTSSAIQISDTIAPGIYTITYSVEDETGNEAVKVVRTLEVLPAKKEDKIDPGK